MRLLNINTINKHPKALLILPEANYDVKAIFTYYLQKLGDYFKDVHVACVKSPDKGRLSHAVFAPENEEIKNYCELNGITVIVTPIAEYLRCFLGSAKKYELERSIGTVKEHEGYQYIPTVHFNVLRFAPNKYKMIDASMRALYAVMSGNHVEEDKLAHITYEIPKTLQEAKEALSSYLDKKVITCDIETTGLTWTKDRILTVSFADSTSTAVCIAVPILGEKSFGLLKNFLKAFYDRGGSIVFHNGVFDVPFIVYNCFMKDLDDYKGMLEGVNTFRLDDTIIMAYLCLNSTERPVLGLKDLAFSEFGDWDLSIDQSKLEHYPIDEVCRYNAIDCMATMYLYEKYNELLVTEEQYELYDSYYRKTMLAMIKLKMTGLTLDKLKVDEAYDKLDEIVESAIVKLQDYPKVLELRALLNKEAMLKYNSTHKKQKSLEEFNEAFNPSSTTHKRLLLFDIMGFKAEKQTKTGNDSTDKEVIVEFLAQSSGEDAEIIQLILDISQASIIRNNFLKAFRERSVVTPSGECKLFGDYKMFGTLSGRLSSSNPFR